MKAKIIDGQVFNNGITCLKANIGKKHKYGAWVGLFKCHCGNEFEGLPYKVKNYYKGCGCLLGKASKHGYTKHPLHPLYKAMIARCFNKKNKGYMNYGGRGITVCERWLGEKGFENFLNDMGDRPEGFSLDRVDNNGNYEPENCEWRDRFDQAANKRNNIIYEFKDCHITLNRLSELTGTCKARIDKAYTVGMDLDTLILKMKNLKGSYINGSGWRGIWLDRARGGYKVPTHGSTNGKAKRFKTLEEALYFQSNVLGIDNVKIDV